MTKAFTRCVATSESRWIALSQLAPRLANTDYLSLEP